MEFWDACFLDFVAVEREAAGMDVNPAELISRYDCFVKWGERLHNVFFPTQSEFTSSKLNIETLEQGVKYV